MQESLESIPDEIIAAVRVHLVNVSVGREDGSHAAGSRS